MKAADQGAEEVQRDFDTRGFGADIFNKEPDDSDLDLFRKFVDNAFTYQAKIDQMTDRALDDACPIKRIEPTLRAVSRTSAHGQRRA